MTIHSYRGTASAAPRRAVAAWVLFGVPLLLAGFVVNPGPPAGDATSELVRYGLNHQAVLNAGGWLQVTGTVLTVIFALSIAELARFGNSLPGMLLIVGSTILVATGLSELTAYHALATGNPSTVRVAADAIPGVQLGYSIVAAPIVFGALGFVVVRTAILPKVFGYSALGLGLVFWACGLITVVTSIQDFIDVLSAAQALWWIGVGTFIVIRGLVPVEDKPLPIDGSPSNAPYVSR